MIFLDYIPLIFLQNAYKPFDKLEWIRLKATYLNPRSNTSKRPMMMKDTLERGYVELEFQRMSNLNQHMIN